MCIFESNVVCTDIHLISNNYCVWQLLCCLINDGSFFGAYLLDVGKPFLACSFTHLFSFHLYTNMVFDIKWKRITEVTRSTEDLNNFKINWNIQRWLKNPKSRYLIIGCYFKLGTNPKCFIWFNPTLNSL